MNICDICVCAAKLCLPARGFQSKLLCSSNLFVFVHVCARFLLGLLVLLVRTVDGFMVKMIAGCFTVRHFFVA